MRMDHVERPLYILLVEKEGQSYPTCYISSFYEFYIGEEGKMNTNDHLETKGRILIYCISFILVF